MTLRRCARVRWHAVVLTVSLLPVAALAQPSLVLSSASTTAGVSVALNLTVSSTLGTSLAAVQFTLVYPQGVTLNSVTRGPALTAAAKSMTCAAAAGGFTCIVSGVNTNVIADGVIASVLVTASTSANIAVSAVWGAASDGTVVNLTATGGSVQVNTITQPVIGITETPNGSFSQGQGASYSVTVSNQAGAPPTNATVTVTDTVSTGLTLVSMAGNGWTCTGNTCSRSDPLNGGASYPVITVTVNVASNAPSTLTNQVSVSGGGSASASATSTVSLGPSVGLPTAAPAAFTQNTPTTVTVTVPITPTPVSNSVYLLRVTASGPTLLGIMHDDGLNGDAVAGDGIYTLQVAFNETNTGQFQLEVSAAFNGVFKRVVSAPVTLTVQVLLTVGAPAPTPSTLIANLPTTVTVTVPVTPTPVSNSVYLLQLTASGPTLLGIMHDDGLNGDAVAGDGIYTLQVVFAQAGPGQVSLEATAAFSGTFKRVASPSITINVSAFGNSLLENFTTARTNLSGGSLWQPNNGIGSGNQSGGINNGVYQLLGFTSPASGAIVDLQFLPSPYLAPRGFAQGWILSGTADPNANRLRFAAKCSATMPASLVTLGTYVKVTTDTNSANPGTNYFHTRSPNWTAGRWMVLEYNRHPQFKQGDNPAVDYPEDPEWVTPTTGGPVHYFNGLTEFYFTISLNTFPSLPVTCSFADVYFDTDTSGSPDTLVSSVAATHNGTAYEVNWAGPKNVTQQYVVYYATQSMKVNGVNSGTLGGIVSNSVSGLDAYWISPNMPEQPDFYVAIQPVGQSAFTEIHLPAINSSGR